MNVAEHAQVNGHTICPDGTIISPNGIVLKQWSNECGYQCVSLWICGKKYTRKVHRLVALAYVPNPDDKPQVNHIDEDKTNNHVSNLEWVTAKENMNHGTGYTSRAKKCMVPVAQYENGVKIAEFESVTAAAKALGVRHSNICQSMSRGTRVHRKYLFRRLT